MKVNWRRVGAVLRKDLREFRRNGNTVYTMAFLPIIFVVQPLVQVLTLSSAASGVLRHEHSLIYMLGIPALVPAALASYSVVGERVQGTLEPILTTPVTREELLLGKFLAAFLPAVVISYLVFGIFSGVVEVFAAPGVAPAIIQGPLLLVQVIFTPLISALSIWIGIGVSARFNDVRAAGQFSILVSLPTVVVTSLTAFRVIPATLQVALAFGVLLVVLDRLGWRLAAAVFDRERLIVNTK